MQIVDIIIILILGLGAATGFARGFIKQTVQSLGWIVVLIFAFLFKSNLAAILYKIFPSFKFGGLFEGISSLNILVYEVIAFIILLFIFGIIFRIILMFASFIEGFLKATFVLAIPSKILGALLGLVEAYIIIFVVLYILTLPVFNIDMIQKSKFKDKILESTPIMSKLIEKSTESFKEIYALKDSLINESDRLKLDKMVLEILIDNKIITVDKAKELYEEGKLNIK